MRISSTPLAILVVVSMFGTIAVTAIAGLWKTESDRVPRRFTSGELAGSYDPADIRGSYTFADVERSFGIPVAILSEAFGTPEAVSADFRASDLEEHLGEIGEYEVGTDSVRLFVASYLGLPHEPEETTGLPASALRLLREHYEAADMDTVALDHLVDRRVVTPRIVLGEDGAIVTADSARTEATALQQPADDHGSAEGEESVRGRTTFADLLAWGLSREQVEAVIGVPVPPRATLIRDFAAENGLPFSDLRTRFQTLLDER